MRRIRIERRVAAPWLIAVGFFCATAFSSVRTRAGASEDRAQARTHFDQGVALARKQAYSEALSEFQHAYELSPHFSVLYNIGQALIALGRPTQAIAALERYVEEGGANIEPRRRAEVDAALESETAKTGRVEVTVDVSSALVSIDGTPYGRSPLPMPVRVDPGAHQILAALDSGEQRTAEIAVDAGQIGHVQLEFGGPVTS
ncbi:MAG: tetratricopeptide repeat protein, partial [Polyangiaceae bacterium]